MCVRMCVRIGGARLGVPPTIGCVLRFGGLSVRPFQLRLDIRAGPVGIEQRGDGLSDAAPLFERKLGNPGKRNVVGRERARLPVMAYETQVDDGFFVAKRFGAAEELIEVERHPKPRTIARLPLAASAIIT